MAGVFRARRLKILESHLTLENMASGWNSGMWTIGYRGRRGCSCEYDDPLSTPRQKKPVSRTVSPRLVPWTYCPPLKK
ncbi:hypothetical protein J6590_080415 [Homalodisca vitripennis]|nr:hypothetical protein J6590_080415 [Homalodisca vitripennis]